MTLTDRRIGLLTSGLLVLFAIFEFEGTPIRLLVAFCLIYQAIVFGKRQAPESNPVLRFVIGLGAFLALQSLVQAAWYYAGWPLGWGSDAISAAMATLAIAFMSRSRLAGYARNVQASTGPVVWLIALLAGAYILRGAALGATDEAIRTPWPLLPPGTLLAFALIAGAALLAAWRTKKTALVAAIAGIGAVSLSSITVLVYRLGYGFDGFLHRASENIILQTGTLEPKRLYYIGQYVFTTWLSRFFELSIDDVDRWLLPAALILLLIAIYLAMKRFEATAFVGLSLLFPWAAFVTTTPQAFAYVLGFSALCLALARKEQQLGYWAPIALGLWALVTHPLAGLPFALMTLAILIRRPWLSWIFVGFSAFSVPLAFLATGLGRWTEIDWAKLINAFWPPANHAVMWSDWASFVAYLAPLSLIVLALVAIKKDREHRNMWSALLSGALGVAIGGLLLKASGDFTFLIDYERGNYADRLFVVSALLAILPAMRGLGYFLKPSLVTALILMAWSAASAYNALPRHDAAAASRGWSVSRDDFEAVRWIEQNAGVEPYTVLANQSVSAAAVQTYGFKRYVKSPAGEDVFYYPIPTGGDLYQLYLQAVSPTPSFEAIREAGILGQSQLVYVVLNKYWWDAERVAGALSARAEESRAFEGVSVYKFRINNNLN